MEKKSNIFRTALELSYDKQEANYLHKIVIYFFDNTIECVELGICDEDELCKAIDLLNLEMGGFIKIDWGAFDE